MVMLPLLSVELGVRLRLRLMTLMVELVMVVPPGQPQPQPPQPDDCGHDTGFSVGHGQPVELVPAVGRHSSPSQQQTPLLCYRRCFCHDVRGNSQHRCNGCCCSDVMLLRMAFSCAATCATHLEQQGGCRLASVARQRPGRTALQERPIPRLRVSASQGADTDQDSAGCRCGQ
jgi:hypothetical protein